MQFSRIQWYQVRNHDRVRKVESGSSLNIKTPRELADANCGELHALTCLASEMITQARWSKLHLVYLQSLVVTTKKKIWRSQSMHYKLHVLALCSNEPHLLHLLSAFLRTLLGCPVSNTGSIFSVLSVCCSSTTRLRTNSWPSWIVIDPSCRMHPFWRTRFCFWCWFSARRAANSAIKSAFVDCLNYSDPCPVPWLFCPWSALPIWCCDHFRGWNNTHLEASFIKVEDVLFYDANL
jgi:hypothetical protein